MEKSDPQTTPSGYMYEMRGAIKKRFRLKHFRMEEGCWVFYTIPEICCQFKVWEWSNV